MSMLRAEGEAEVIDLWVNVPFYLTYSHEFSRSLFVFVTKSEGLNIQLEETSFLIKDVDLVVDLCSQNKNE